MRDFIEAARNIGCMHFINALTLAIKSHKTQAMLETRDEDLDVVLKAHSDMRELFTLIDLHEPAAIPCSRSCRAPPTTCSASTGSASRPTR